MGGPIRLLKAFDVGELKAIHMVNGDEKGPSTGCAWLILGGVISHVTATLTGLIAMAGDPGATGKAPDYIASWYEPAASASGFMNYFSAEAAVLGTNRRPASQLIVLKEGDVLVFSGATTAWADIRYLEWRP